MWCAGSVLAQITAHKMDQHQTASFMCALSLKGLRELSWMVLLQLRARAAQAQRSMLLNIRGFS